MMDGCRGFAGHSQAFTGHLRGIPPAQAPAEPDPAAALGTLAEKTSDGMDGPLQAECSKVLPWLLL